MLKELKEFVKHLTKQAIETGENVDKEKFYKILKSCISLLKALVDDKKYSEKFIFQTLVTTLSYLLTLQDFDLTVQNQACQLCEKFLKVSGRGSSDNNEVGVCTVNFLLELTLGKKSKKPVTKADIKRVWDLKGFIISLCILNPVLENTKNLLLECVTSLTYLNTREGRLHIASVLSKDVTLVKPIQEIIRQYLPELTKNQAAYYGEVYFNAWNMAKPNVQKEIEECCIQDLMERVFTLNRHGLEMGKIGVRVLMILSSLHSSRRLHKFSDKITELYAPLIWRYLRSDHPLVRCNAAQVFLDVFPLEKPYGGVVVNSEFLKKQLKEMQALMLDDCHLVRAITVKGVCRHLCNSIDCLTVGDVKQLLQIITDKLASDGSSFQVRTAVFEGLELMMLKPHSASLVASILPHMHLHLHDENEKVRKAFVKVLLKLNEKSEDINVCYWEAVPLEHLIARLCEENDVVGEEIVKLLIRDVYTKGQSVEKTIKHLIKIISINPRGVVKLFKYSENVLKPVEAYEIIVSILGTLRKRLKEKVESENLTTSQNSNSSRKRHKKVLQDVSNNGGNTENEGSDSSPPAGQTEERLIDNHRNVVALISGASTLWAVFSTELQHKKYLDALYILGNEFIPFFLLNFKNTLVYYAVINLASLIPINILAPVSTVAGACISELKEMTEETPEDVLKCLIFSLCAWNRGNEVIDLAVEWLNYGFGLHDLSESIVPVRKTRRPRKVRFKPVIGKPMLAVRLLDCLLDNSVNERRLLEKNYNCIYELYKFLDRIKALLEKRLSRGAPFDDLLTDEVLYGCYKRYLLLPSCLHRPQQPPDSASFISTTGESTDAVIAAKECIEHLTWVAGSLMNYLPQKRASEKDGEEDDEQEEEDIPFCVKCLLLVLTTANMTISLNLADILFAKAVAIFAINLLGTEWSPYFLEKSIDTAVSLAEHAQTYTPNDEWNLFKMVLPSLLSRILETIAHIKLTPQNITVYTNDYRQMKLSLFKCLTIIERCSWPNSTDFNKVFNFFIYSCIEMIVTKISEENEFTPYTKLDDHPMMVSTIMKFFIKKGGKITDQILKSLNEHITLNKQDGIYLLGCLSLLYTLAHCAKTILKRDQFEDCVHNAYACIKHFNNIDKSNISLQDSNFFAETSEMIDVYKTGDEIIKQLCKHIGCAPKKF
ncbi:condensin-2 complex subunit G2-like isoform X2 [Rhodnius prolixus]